MTYDLDVSTFDMLVSVWTVSATFCEFSIMFFSRVRG